MVVEFSSMAVAFFSLLGGSLGRAAYPFLQERKNKEDEVRALQDIPEDQLTPEEKQLIENFNKPLNFLKYYKYTAIIGVGASIMISLSSLVSATQNLPSGDSLNLAVGLIPVWLLTGWGGGDISNQLIKSGTSTATTVKKAVLSRLLSSKKQEFDDSL
jgi:hypothetical protein